MQGKRDDDGTACFRLLLDTDAALARVLNVSPPAVRKAAEWGKIEREPDGRWEVFAVLDGWRMMTNPGLQRPGARRPWLNPDRPITSALVTELIRRTRAAGGTVQAQGGDGKWREAPDRGRARRGGSDRRTWDFW